MLYDDIFIILHCITLLFFILLYHRKTLKTLHKSKIIYLLNPRFWELCCVKVISNYSFKCIWFRRIK